jgi:hypothetical protein
MMASDSQNIFLGASRCKQTQSRYTFGELHFCSIRATTASHSIPMIKGFIRPQIFWRAQAEKTVETNNIENTNREKTGEDRPDNPEDMEHKNTASRAEKSSPQREKGKEKYIHWEVLCLPLSSLVSRVAFIDKVGNILTIS